MKKYDIIVIGGGVAGVNAAMEAAQKGRFVMLLENNQIGGTCLNFGCIPSKYLLTTAEEFEKICKKTKSGIWCGDIQFNFFEFQRECLKTIQLLKRGMLNSLQQLKVDIVKGTGVFDGKKVIVNGEEFLADDFILATGSTPKIPNIDGLKDAISSGYAYTNENIFEGSFLPDNLIVIGGGVSGIELAYAYALLGTKVTVLEAASRILTMFDSDVSEKVKQLLMQNGVIVKTSVHIEAIEEKNVYYIEYDCPNSIKCDMIYISTGRDPCDTYIPHDIKRDDRGFVATNLFMQTNISHVYAIGDITGKGMLAYTGIKQAQRAVDHIVGNPMNGKNGILPQVLFLSPECMQIGIMENELLRNGIEYYKTELSMNFSGRFVINQIEMSSVAFIKLLVNTQDVLLGAVMISSHASEMAVMFEMMIEKQMTIQDIVNFVYPHPTECEIIHDCAKKYLEIKGKS